MAKSLYYGSSRLKKKSDVIDHATGKIFLLCFPAKAILERKNMSDYEDCPTLEEWLEEHRGERDVIDIISIYVVRDIEDFLSEKDDDDYNIYDDGYAIISELHFCDLIDGLDDEEARPWQARNWYDYRVLGDSPSYNDDWQMTIFAED